METGLIIILSGPAGSGKGAVCGELQKTGKYVLSVSRTTRDPRPGEKIDVSYHYITKREFEKYLAEDDFLESNEYTGEYYGTPKKFALDTIASGKNIILEIDVNGGRQVKARYPGAVKIMLLPTSFAEQEARLRGRGTETEEKIQKRLAQTHVELESVGEYDYVVYNYDGRIAEAAETVDAIITAEKCAAGKADPKDPAVASALKIAEKCRMSNNPNVKEKYFGK